jgi:hypothetical protein
VRKPIAKLDKKFAKYPFINDKALAHVDVNNLFSIYIHLFNPIENLK